ncbi:hypothetical protein [Aquipuribacter sp. MA13-6]|uniref:hypothetical protein n=1 Tax=unclassified Aquipuribacter TaxID=2635084 RepID=UPI003EE86B53
MNHFAMTPGLLLDAEVAYRHEVLARDLAGPRPSRRWWGTRRRSTSQAEHDLVLAA